MSAVSVDVGSLCDRVVAEVKQFGGPEPADADITLVVVQYAGDERDKAQPEVCDGAA